MKTYSFDIFDTCFIRSCGTPHNLFDLLAYRILGDESDESSRTDFAFIRIEGERKARISLKKEDIKLTDIYAYCDFTGITNIPNTEISKAEIEIEQEQIIPVYAIQQQIKQLHQKGHAIYYISDMYLPQHFLQELLIKHGFWETGDKLYVSSTYGKTKQTGNLFRHIAVENGLCFKQWYHKGDNWYSDYYIPHRMGIKATHIHHKSSIYERFLENQSFFSSFFVNQHLFGISKAVRLSFPQTPEYAFAANLIAPLYVPFVYQILQNAVNQNIKRIFFLARDGYILYQIAKELGKEFPNIEIKYLYVSRSSLYLPGLPQITPEALLSLKKTAFGFTKETQLDILRNFISPDTFERIERLTYQNTDNDLFNNLNVLNILTTYHDQQRKLILKYFIQEGLADNSYKTAIVDIRGTRSCQQAINTILQQGNFNLTVGYYLEVLKERKTIQEAGNYHALYYEERMISNPFLRYISGELGSILEQYFSLSPHQRTIAYYEENGTIRPLFENNEEGEGTGTQELVKCHEEIISSFTNMFIKNKLYLHTPIVLILSTKLLSYFSQKPTFYYLKALHSMKVNSKKGKYMYIVKPLSFMDIKDRRICWWRGAIYFTIRTTIGYRLINKIFYISKRILKKLNS